MSDPQSLPGREAVDALEVVCTDKGQHPRSFLARVTWQEDGTASMPYMPLGRRSNGVSDEDDDRSAPSWSMPNPDYDEGESSWTSYTFWCRRCDRDLQVRSERWWESVNRCREAGVTFVDISVLG